MKSFWTVSESAEQDNNIHVYCDTLRCLLSNSLFRKAVSLKSDTLNRDWAIFQPGRGAKYWIFLISSAGTRIA